MNILWHTLLRLEGPISVPFTTAPLLEVISIYLAPARTLRLFNHEHDVTLKRQHVPWTSGDTLVAYLDDAKRERHSMWHVSLSHVIPIEFSNTRESTSAHAEKNGAYAGTPTWYFFNFIMKCNFIEISITVSLVRNNAMICLTFLYLYFKTIRSWFSPLLHIIEHDMPQPIAHPHDS